MKNFKKLIAVIAGVLCCISVSAGITSADLAAAGVRTVSPQCRSTLQSLDNTQVINFLQTVATEIDANDSDIVNVLLNYYKGHENPVDPGFDPSTLPDMASFIDLINEFSDYLAPYIERVLPLYIYLMRDRVTPDYATDLCKYSVDTVYAAPVDEIFYGIGDDRNHYEPYGLSEQAIEEGIAAGGQVKHNQSYLWGMVTVGEKVYWCTNTNYLCLGGASGLGSAANPGEDVSGGYQNGCWVCEFASGKYGQEVHAAVDPSYAQYSDTRIPRIYCYDTTTGVVEDITPSGGDYDMMLQDCQGLRSAGYHNGVVFFGGPSLYGSTSGNTIGSSFFALDADTGQFISCNDLSDVDGNTITDVRRWFVHNDILYCGVRVTDVNGKDRGAVLRWYGDKQNPWQFKIVGWMANEAAELCVYNNHMYVGGWNTNTLNESTVVKSTEIPADGLQPVGIDDPEWDIIWRYSDYDKHIQAQRITYTAGLQVWNGQLYWGMFCAVYTLPNIAVKMGYTDFTTPEALSFYLGSLRQTSFWRLDENDNIELLYGETELPVWNRFYTGEDSWEMVETGYTPTFGRAGFGQPWTAYTWTMAEYHDDLYIGTMNAETLLRAASTSADGSVNPLFSIMRLLTGNKYGREGFELLRWSNPDEAPEYITTDGFGNGTAYGIRNFTLCGDDLYIGSASPLNLELYGGWHLFRLHEDTTEGVTAAELPTLGLIFRNAPEAITFASADGSNLASVRIYTLDGTEVYTAAPATNTHTIPAANLPAGVLVANITIGTRTYTAKLSR